jgi:hypothetical protein
VEIVFRVDPDHGSGSLEAVVTLVFMAVAALSTVLGSLEWRRGVRSRGPARATI